MRKVKIELKKVIKGGGEQKIKNNGGQENVERRKNWKMHKNEQEF